jgi:L-rhamnose isomerase
MTTKNSILYAEAKNRYKEFGVDTDSVLERIKDIPLSIHCWQGDDVSGFEVEGAVLGNGGILSTGSYPGKARNIDELKDDIAVAFSLIPGTKKLNLHSIYGDFKNVFIQRDKIEKKHFDFWIDWAKENNTGIDFNPTLFSHPLSETGYTLSSQDKKIRNFWIDHVKRCREISNYIGGSLKKQCVNNIWIPDGSKDITTNKMAHRKILMESLDEIFDIDYPVINMIDAVESKLFGIGSESYVVGSHEFYLNYALSRKKVITYDTGHFHPTELVSDKISATTLFFDKILLHISRGIRWDSDHVVILSDELINLMNEIVRADALDQFYFGLDFFDGSINRIAAWVIGSRATLKSLLIAMLEPTEMLRRFEENGDFSSRLSYIEGLKTLPFGNIWNHFCESNGYLDDFEIMQVIKSYESKVIESRK